MADVMLTTFDNPYNPFTHFEDWVRFDESQGYFTNSLLARVANYSDELSEADQDLAVETAIDEIVKDDATLMYKKVFK